jgi:hypothetical protein
MSVTGQIREDSAFSVLLRIEHDGANAVQADIDSIEYQIFPHYSTTAHTTATALTVSDVIYDTLQTDDIWDEDATGYNFRHDVAATTFPSPDDYELEYKVTFAGSSVVYLQPIRLVVQAIKSI